ncbi:MAG: phosphomannomutase/phosphoglucomutase [Candidatus Woesearchaeota archaeon]
MTGIFKAYDIRGIYPSEINEAIAYKIGRAFVRFIKPKKVVVCRDIRLSSGLLTEALIEGILHEGADVIDIGEGSIPYFYFALAHYNYDAGIMVTASHNPPEYNGFKICGKGTKIIGYEDGINKIEEIFHKDDFDQGKNANIMEKKDVFNDYKKFILSKAKELPNYKIIIDYSNGAETLITPRILLDTNLTVININQTPDGNFPAHGPDPTKKGALKQLSLAVKEEKADFGLVVDGDADRVIFVDEKGKEVRTDILLAFLADEILKRKEGNTFVYATNCSRIVKEIIEKHNGTTIKSRIGRAFIRKKCEENNADLGGELSGHYFLKEYFFVENWLLVLFKIARYISEEKKPFSVLLKKYQKYKQSGEINFKVLDKEAILEKVKKKYDNGNIDELDGVTIEYDDWWFNLRPSNTEPLIRLNVEAKNASLLKKQLRKISEIIKNKDSHL